MRDEKAMKDRWVWVEDSTPSVITSMTLKVSKSNLIFNLTFCVESTYPIIKIQIKINRIVQQKHVTFRHKAKKFVKKFEDIPSVSYLIISSVEFFKNG